MLFRNDPYTSITIEQSANEVRLIFGSHWWEVKPMGLPSPNSKEGKVSRHCFTVNLDLIPMPFPTFTFFFKNWHRSPQSLSDEIGKLLVLGAESNSSVCANTIDKDATVGSDETKDISHLRRPMSEIALVKTMFRLFSESVGHALIPLGDIWTKQTYKFSGNPGDYWSINTKPFKGAHFAVYPVDICIRPILSSCPPNGVVLDPMCGSGTTCLTAQLINLKRWDLLGYEPNETAKSIDWRLKWIGIDINRSYVELARDRLKPYLVKTMLDYG
jgi:hypothetical protein